MSQYGAGSWELSRVVNINQQPTLQNTFPKKLPNGTGGLIWHT